MDKILDVVIEVLRTDETNGQTSLESLIQLTEAYGEIWTKTISKLIFVISQIIANKNFEDSTRQSALEIISSIAEHTTGLLRKQQADLKTHFFPAILQMMTEVEYEDDIEEWSKHVEEEVQTKNDPASVATDSLNRIATSLQ